MKRYFVKDLEPKFLTKAERAEMDAADKAFRESDEGSQRCYVMEIPAHG